VGSEGVDCGWEVKQVDLAEQMLRALGKTGGRPEREGTAGRRSHVMRRATYSASEKLAMEAQVIQTAASGYSDTLLQPCPTLVEIGEEKNTTIVVRLPVDLLDGRSKH